LINYSQEAGRCARGEDIGECVLFYSVADISLITFITKSPVGAYQVIAYAERNTLCRRVLPMHSIVSIHGSEASVKENSCVSASLKEAFCDVCTKGKEYALEDEDMVVVDIRQIVDITSAITGNATVVNIADIYMRNTDGKKTYPMHPYILDPSHTPIARTHELACFFIRRLVAFEILAVNVVSYPKTNIHQRVRNDSLFIITNGRYLPSATNINVQALPYLLRRYEK
jgi:superfamily II DNA helicase RecQ